MCVRSSLLVLDKLRYDYTVLLFHFSREFLWKRCCGCSQTLLQTDFDVSVLHHLVLSNRSCAVR